MIELLLLRHAKSDHPEGMSDFDRPLNKRGIKDAPRMGKVLRKTDLQPDLIISSPAVRAKETAEAAAATCGYTDAVDFQQILYDGSTRDYIKTIQSAPADKKRLMLVGHNPHIEDVVDYLSSGGNLSVKFPTAGLALIRFETESWAQVREKEGMLISFMLPKHLKKVMKSTD